MNSHQSHLIQRACARWISLSFTKLRGLLDCRGWG